MGKTFEEITPELREWIAEQRVFFVATAPHSAQGLVNCSPKGMDSFRILGPKEVGYLDFTGSGIETAAHLAENGRIVFMFCAFSGPPKILRCHGFGAYHLPGSPGFREVQDAFPLLPGVRGIVRAHLTRISDSCGFGVPRYDFLEERDTLVRWAESKGPEELAAYHAARNAQSIDGLPGLTLDNTGRMESPGILGSVGRTPLVELRRVVPGGCARVLVKLESHNPTGSMKDRMALAVIDGAVASGRLAPSGTVVEYTGGSTGTSLAFVCAARGFSITLVTSDAFSREKRDHMRALGATLIEIPSEAGGTTKELIQRMIAEAARLSSQPGWFYADQFNNPDAAAGYAPLAHELWAQSDGRLDAFVQSVGTAQCITGVTSVLRKRRDGIRIVAVEPAESPVLSGGLPGAHKIEGVGPGFIPPVWKDGLADEIVQVSTAEAKEMTRRLAREEALFCGTSSGANVVAALQVAQRLGPGKTVATLVCDSGLKYLSTDVYSSGLQNR